jgi:ribosome-associated toxin RatA of RatAB toxin-antitoxin module
MFWKLKKFTPLAPASMTVGAEVSAVFDVLTDYENYLEWFPLTNHSKLLVKEGDDLAIAEFAFDKSKGAKLTMECIHTKNEMVLHRRIAGHMPVLRVQWNLAPEGSGTKVTLRTEMELGNWRLLLPGLAQNLMDQSLMKALEGRINAFSSTFADEGGRKFLEVVQTNEYLEVWFMGKKYKLTPIDE